MTGVHMYKRVHIRVCNMMRITSLHVLVEVDAEEVCEGAQLNDDLCDRAGGAEDEERLASEQRVGHAGEAVGDEVFGDADAVVGFVRHVDAEGHRAAAEEGRREGVRGGAMGGAERVGQVGGGVELRGERLAWLLLGCS